VNAEEVMMFPLKKILCPVDFSVPSFEGLKVAKELAQTYSAELILINVVQPVQAVAAPGVPASYSVREYYEEMAEAARKSFEEVVENRVPKGVTVRTKVVEGQPADEIVREAQAENVDIIVTATHGWTGWRRFIFGSVAEKVVRLSTCPVLTVPGPSGENQ
jgi:universal stress protein A